MANGIIIIFKTNHYEFWWANLFPYFIGLLNLALLVIVILMFIRQDFIAALMILFIKNMADFSIINANQAFKKPINTLTILLMQPWQWLYPILLPFVKSDWKR